jgi:hypothetical protein
LKFTATELVTQYQCPFLRWVSYEIREPLPVWGTNRKFGNVLHRAIEEYEKNHRRLEVALAVLDAEASALTGDDLREARSILEWRHERQSGRDGRAVLIEGPLRSSVLGHRLDVRLDRLDAVGKGYLLAEYKGGKKVDLRLVRTQLGILSYAVWDVFGKAPRQWEVELLRKREVVSLPARKSPKALKDLVTRLAAGIAEGDREPRPYDAAFCKRCPARSHCPKVTAHPKPFTRIPAEQSAQLSLF